MSAGLERDQPTTVGGPSGEVGLDALIMTRPVPQECVKLRKMSINTHIAA